MIIKDVLETDPICADIKEKSYSVPALKEVLETRTTALHVQYNLCSKMLKSILSTSNKMWAIMAGIHKMLARLSNQDALD